MGDCGRGPGRSPPTHDPWDSPAAGATTGYHARHVPHLKCSIKPVIQVYVIGALAQVGLEAANATKAGQFASTRVWYYRPATTHDLSFNSSGDFKQERAFLSR